MDYHLSFTPRFVQLLEEIGDYLALDSPTTALRWVDELERQLSRLKRFPEGHAPARENQGHPIELRQMLYGKGRHQYRVIFTIQDAEVIILDLRHGARNAHPPGDL